MPNPYDLFTFIRDSVFTLFLVLIIAASAIGQDQREADSLETIFQSGEYEKSRELIILKELAIQETDPDKKLKYGNLLLSKAIALDSILAILSAHHEIGNGYLMKGEFNAAIQQYFKGAKFAVDNKLTRNESFFYISIADVYSEMGNNENAIEYYVNGINLMSNSEDSIEIAVGIFNLSDEYLKSGMLDSALKYTEQAARYFDNLGFALGAAYCLGNKGVIHAESGDNELAEKCISDAIEVLEGFGDITAISEYLNKLSDLYVDRGDFPLALDYAERSLNLASEFDIKQEISDANLRISAIHELMGNSDLALYHFKKHDLYLDSIINIDSIMQVANMATDFEVAKKQTEVDLLNQKQRNQQILNRFITSVLGLILIISGILFWFYKSVQHEKKRSDRLLHNILPHETAEELKATGKVVAERFEEVSVLFTDFKGFTTFSSNLSPEKLVEVVDHYFSKFDEIVEKHGLEKIKTIGDAYMCACGLPFPKKDHAKRAIKAALEMANFVHKEKSLRTNEQGSFDIRLGIHSGPVVAGVVGHKKFAYDIWGDTVNTASRMESNSIAGMITISQKTYELIKDDFDCEFRGEVDVKNKGMMPVYFVKGLKEELAA